MVAGFVPADHEIWVIGDKQMTFVSQHLEYWKEKARRDPHESLHILRWYDVKAFPPQSMSSNAVEVILSSLVGALNNRPKLPHTIVVMFGDTKFWCDSQTLKFTMDTILIILVRELQRIVQERQKDLPLKAVGMDPAIFFVKLNWKPDNALESVHSYPKKRRTFNKLLDSIVRPRGGNTILLHEVNGSLDEQLFLNHGELSEKGYRQIWKSLSEAIQDFELQGHQKKKEFVTLPKHIGEVDSSILSSDDECKFEAREIASQMGRNNNPKFGVNENTPKIQNKRRFNKKNKTSMTHFNKNIRYGQSFFHHKY